jgi:peptide/nickel transport system permease protein
VPAWLGLATRRLLVSVPVLIAFSVPMYALVYLSSDPTARVRQIPGLSAEDQARIIAQNGYDLPWYEGYPQWLWGFVRGDWGLSETTAVTPASEVIADALPATLELMVGALLLALLVGLPLGVWAAVRRDSALDLATTSAAYLGYAVPTFLLGLLLQLAALWTADEGWAVVPLVAGLVLMALSARAALRSVGPRLVLAAGTALVVLGIAGWGRLGGGGELLLPTAGRYPDGGAPWFSWDHFRHLVLPVLTLSLAYMAAWSRYQRSSMLDVLGAEYLRTARAKGLRERAVIGRHALRNALLPLIAVVAVDVGLLFTGAVVVESIFDLDGVGSVFLTSLTQRDVPVAMGVIMIGALAVVVVNLIADLLSAAADPRIRTP